MVWLAPSELRIGLGCMRLSTDADRDPDQAAQTIEAAVGAGITVFDTARAYGHDAGELGHNERLLAQALRRSGAAAPRAHGRGIVTKGGMTREGVAWRPDGRAKAIRADCEASLSALDGLAIDTYLLHAPDPRTPWTTSVRALARLHADGLVARVGVANVNRRQLDEALELAPISAVQVALSPFDDGPLRGGLVERCLERGIAVIAHAPLGRAASRAALAGAPAGAGSRSRRATAPRRPRSRWRGCCLSPPPWSRSPAPGAPTRRAAPPARRRSSVTAADRALRPTPLGAAPAPARTARGSTRDADVVMVMGIPGAGKTRLADDYVARGYERLNRDERGGSLRDIAQALDERLGAGARRIVLDNTYLTRAARSLVIESAARHGVPVRCVWLSTPLAQAQVHLVTRLIALHGALPTPEELRVLARSTEGVMAPTSQMRTLRELEPPALDEGFAAVDEVAFQRAGADDQGGAGVLVAAPALERTGWREAVAAAAPAAPHLLFDWRPDGDARTILDDAAGPSRSRRRLRRGLGRAVSPRRRAAPLLV